MLNQQLPIVELHRHLDGNIRPSTIWSLVQKNKLSLEVSSEQDVASLVQINDKTSDLLAFLAKLDIGVSVLASEEDCFRIAYENVEDAANSCLDYVELRFSPFYMSKAFSLSMDAVIEAVCSGIKQGMRDFPVKCQLIGILSRTFGVDTCADELNALLNHKNQLCGLDLAGDELNFPAELFKTHFTKARDAGLNITVHAGEADGPHSIWNAIRVLGAQRIGHGVAAIKDSQLMNYLASNEIGIETCLTSNYHTATVSDIHCHPLKQFVERGIQVTLSTDDPGVSAIDLNHEYKLAKNIIGLSQSQLDAIQRNGVKQAFLTPLEKEALFNSAKQRSKVL
jgi:adenosine deaminase